jgi:hypothetical protein
VPCIEEDVDFGARIVSAIRFAAGDGEGGVIATPKYQEWRLMIA